MSGLGRSQGGRSMTREAKMRRAKLITLAESLVGRAGFLPYMGSVEARAGIDLPDRAGHRRGRPVPSMGHCSLQLGFRNLGGLLLCLYYYLYSNPDPAAIDRDYRTLAMGHTCWRVSWWFPGPLPT